MLNEEKAVKQKAFESLLVKDNLTIKEALSQMGVGGKKILIVVDGEGKMKGTLTDGDIRRWILDEGSLSESISLIYNAEPKCLKEGYVLKDVRDWMAKEKIDAVPVLGKDQKVLDVVFWSDIISETTETVKGALNLPVLIMAGGKGTRLEPFTKIFPKPLIPFGDKPMIELILDRFSGFGCKEFFLSVNYKGKMIESYFEQTDNPYDVSFIWENEPTGTAGSLREAAKHIQSTDLFVSNCDIMVKADYVDIHQFHQRHENDITIVGSVQHVSVPFGVLQMKSGGVLEEIVEKPEYDVLVNTGFYLIKKEVIDHIPSDKPYDFPDLIQQVKSSGGQIRVYPVSQESWVDIGQWQEYQNALRHLKP